MQVVAGLPQHCAALETSVNVSRVGSITGFSFGPDGGLYLIEKPSLNTTRVTSVDSHGMSHAITCSHPISSPSQPSNSRFGANANSSPCTIPSSISSLVVSPDGTIYIADKNLLQIFSLDHAVPHLDHLSGEYSINSPATSEIFVFNRFGQHVTTKDLSSGQISITFSYTKTAFNGKLMAIIDSKSNKLDFVRDNQEQVSVIEVSSTAKSHLTMSRSGALTHINASISSFTLFDYDPVTQLLIGRTESNGLTSIYRYNRYGRLVQAILSNGERVTLEQDALKRVNVQWEKDNSQQVTLASSAPLPGTLFEFLLFLLQLCMLSLESKANLGKTFMFVH